jgi:hypothetical protein
MMRGLYGIIDLDILGYVIKVYRVNNFINPTSITLNLSRHSDPIFLEVAELEAF